MSVVERAPAKANLVLHVGGPRADGLHPLRSIFASLDLWDEVAVHEADVDEVICPGVAGANLAARALAAFRGATPGAALAPLRIEIDKRIPVAAGLGGGSADAAAVLRAANVLAGEPLDRAALRTVAATIGSDVPSQVSPGHALVSGAGEVVEPCGLAELALVLVPSERGLATADVFAELDRLRAAGQAPPARVDLDPRPLRELAAGPAGALAAAAENDLEPATLSLRPELQGVLDALVGEGALAARITGSGPTAIGLFAARGAAEAAAGELAGALVVGTAPAEARP